MNDLTAHLGREAAPLASGPAGRTDRHRRRATTSRSPVLAIAVSLAAGLGLAVAAALVFGAVLGGSEPTITGVVLLCFGVGWALMGHATTRYSSQPQSWTRVPAIALGIVGAGLVILQPGPVAMDIAGWVWPFALAALAIWMIAQARATLHGRGRWVVLPVIAVLLAFSIGGGVTAVTSANASNDAPAEGRLVDVGGRRLYIVCQGSGSPVVILQAGLSGTAAGWSRVAAAVAPSTTVCAYDRAGHGFSDPASAPQDGVAIASDLEILLDRAAIAGPYVLVGFSSGGPYSAVFAANHLDEVAGMVLLDAQPADAFTALPDYPAFYAPYRAVAALAPSLARLGVGIRILGSASDPAGIRAARSMHDEVLALPAALEQARELRTIGDRPLVVLTAGSGQQAGWSAAQERLTRLSTHSAHRVIASASHDTVLAADALASAQAILDVVTSVRTGSPVR